MAPFGHRFGGISHCHSVRHHLLAQPRCKHRDGLPRIRDGSIRSQSDHGNGHLSSWAPPHDGPPPIHFRGTLLHPCDDHPIHRGVQIHELPPNLSDAHIRQRANGSILLQERGPDPPRILLLQ